MKKVDSLFARILHYPAAVADVVVLEANINGWNETLGTCLQGQEEGSQASNSKNMIYVLE